MRMDFTVHDLAPTTDLTVREVAELLRVSESTVRRLIRTRGLPAYRIHEQHRVNRVELQEWALENGVAVAHQRLHARGEGAVGVPDLHAAILRGGVHFQVAGETREEVLRGVAHLPGIPEEVDRDLLHRLLVTREALGSTGVGDGIAIPHPRSPLVLRVAEPIVLLCFLRQEVDFGALDGRPVRVLFTILSPAIQTHLALLAKLAHFLHDEPLRRLLRAPASRDEILARVRALEDGSGPPSRAAERPRPGEAEDAARSGSRRRTE